MLVAWVPSLPPDPGTSNVVMSAVGSAHEGVRNAGSVKGEA